MFGIIYLHKNLWLVVIGTSGETTVIVLLNEQTCLPNTYISYSQITSAAGVEEISFLLSVVVTEETQSQSNN